MFAVVTDVLLRDKQLLRDRQQQKLLLKRPRLKKHKLNIQKKKIEDITLEISDEEYSCIFVGETPYCNHLKL